MIEYLKVRSGKSIKFKVISIKQLLFNAQIFFLIFLANDQCRASVLLRNTEKEKRKLETGKSYFFKNFENVTTIGNIPTFKITSSSVTTLSPRQALNVQDYEEQEMNLIAELIIIENYVDIDILPHAAAQVGPG